MLSPVARINCAPRSAITASIALATLYWPSLPVPISPITRKDTSLSMVVGASGSAGNCCAVKSLALPTGGVGLGWPRFGTEDSLEPPQADSAPKLAPPTRRLRKKLRRSMVLTLPPLMMAREQAQKLWARSVFLFLLRGYGRPR